MLISGEIILKSQLYTSGTALKVSKNTKNNHPNFRVFCQMADNQINN